MLKFLKKRNFIALSLLLLSSTYGQASEQFVRSDKIVLSEDTAEVPFITKKPVIIYHDTQKIGSISVIMLDDMDITAMIKKTKDGFFYKSLMVLPAGEHTLSIIYVKDGEEEQEDYTFTTRQSKMFEKAQTNLDVSAQYENLLRKSENIENAIWSKGEADIGLKTEVGEGKWDYSFETNLRFLEQSEPVESPEIKGLNLSDYLFSANFNGDDLQFGLQIGNVQASESDYSVQGLGSRGATFNAIYKTFELHTFLMDSTQYYGWYGGTGLTADDPNHIYGVSLEKTFFEDTKFKVIYARGGKTEDGFGESSEESSNARREGDVLGFALNTPLIGDKLHLSSELDYSSFDQEVGDGYGYENDKAYNVKLDGLLGEHYSYNVMYEYIGYQYNSIAADGLQNDRSGFSGELDTNYDVHEIDLTVSRYHDNVRGNALAPKVYSTQEALNYTLSKYDNIPMGAGWTHATQKSKDEPTTDDIVNTVTDSANANIGYMTGNWQYGLNFEYAIEKDKTVQNVKSITKTVSFSPTYSVEKFHIEPNFTYNRTKNNQDGDVDTVTTGLGIGGVLGPRKVSYDVSATYEKTLPDIGVGTYTFGAQWQIAYNFAAPGPWMDHPVVGLKGTYNNGSKEDSADTFGESETVSPENYTISLFVSIPLSYTF